MFQRLKEDLDAVMERDPAARSRLEVFFSIPGSRPYGPTAGANWFYRRNLKFIARFISSIPERRRD